MQSLTQPESIADFLAAWLAKPWLREKEQAILSVYYKSYLSHFGEYLRFHYQNQTQELVQCVAEFGQPDVLEVGCGCGTESLYLALNGARVKGIDVSEDRIRVAVARKAVLENLSGEILTCNFEVLSLFDLPPIPSFDIIWMEQSFHHIEPRRDAVKHLAALLRPDGFVVVSESNAWNPLLQFALLRRRGFRTIAEYTDAEGRCHPYGNERIITAHGLCSLFQREGLNPVSSRYFRLFPNWSMADRWGNLERWIPEILKLPFTHYNSVFHKSPNN